MVGRTTWSPIRDVVVGGPLAIGHLAASPWIRERYNRWGATDDEVTRSLPGDELVRRPKSTYTRAVTIDAPPEEVWRWLVQIGQGRGGLYTFDTLENLLRCDIHSVDRILPEHQQLEVGDVIRSGPDNYPCWAVMEVEPDRHLILIGAGTPRSVEIPDTLDVLPARGYAASTWQWVLTPEDTGRTRVLVRQRLAYSPDQERRWRVVEPLHFVFEREMLRGIKARAEASEIDLTELPAFGSRPARYDVTDDAILDSTSCAAFHAIVDEHDGRSAWSGPDESAELREGSSFAEVGAIVDHTVLIRGRVPLRYATKTVAVESGRFIRVEYIDGAFRGEAQWEFEEAYSGTRIRLHWRATPSGMLRPIARILPIAKTHSDMTADGFERLDAYLHTSAARSRALALSG